MTAEIAIVNRAAVAFAADSAVTIRVGNGHKIYNSAEKIFQYCFQRPIGLMVYNNAEFMNVPLEVVIRSFRRDIDSVRSAEPFQSMGNAAEYLLGWLRKFEHRQSDEEDHLNRILVDRFQRIQNRIIRELRAEKPRSDQKSSFPSRLKETLAKLTAMERGDALPGFLSKVRATDFRVRYGKACSSAAHSVFGNLAYGLDSEIVEFALAVVKSKNLSQQFTGFVIGGFADDALFPSVCSFVVDGIYFNEIKSLPVKEMAVDRRRGFRADVLPFARQEMAQRFIFGIDEDFEEDILAYLRVVVSGAVSGTAPPNYRDEVTDVACTQLKNLLTENREYLRQDLVGIVDYMSKAELADMAHTMVDLASKKLRFSAEAETVGGPIDVAVISRHEGFIWIARKQYFDPAKNQHYFARVYGNLPKPSEPGGRYNGSLSNPNEGADDDSETFGEGRGQKSGQKRKAKRRVSRSRGPKAAPRRP